MKYNFLYEGAISRSVKNAASELKTKQAKTLMGGLNKIKDALTELGSEPKMWYNYLSLICFLILLTLVLPSSDFTVL